MDDIEGAQMSLNVKDGSGSANIVSTYDVGQMSGFVTDPIDDLSFFQIVFDWISFIDVGVWESDSSGIMSDNVWDFVGTNSLFDNLAQFEISFSAFDACEDESSLFIIEKSVVFSSLHNSKDIHDSNWEFSVSSDFMVNFESTFLVLSYNGNLSSWSS